MKKSLFFFAAAALALTACTNDDDALQTGQVQNSNRAVAFDTYTAGTTRAGDPTGVMTTDKLKEFNGFGVFAFYHNDGAVYTSGAHRPDFMYKSMKVLSGKSKQPGFSFSNMSTMRFTTSFGVNIWLVRWGGI